jgi:prephenate dehydrogenase
MQIGVIGFGTFGRFMCSYLKQRADVLVYDQRGLEEEMETFGVEAALLDDVLKQDVIILAIPVQEQEAFWQVNGSSVNPQALVIDVSSVKTKPVELMQEYLPASCEILATHPLFGPQSGAQGIEGLSVVFWPVRMQAEKADQIKQLLEQDFGLHVILKSPEDHDKDMAYVQALTFYIGRAIGRMGIPDTKLKTRTYQHLFEIEQIVNKDTDELFLTIQHENPYADDVREELLKHLQDIDRELDRS